MIGFRCERDALVEALTTAGRAVATRGGALPVLSGVRLEVQENRLHVAGSDLDLTIEAELEVTGTADGACVIPARTATEITRALDPGAVAVEGETDEVRIAAGKYQSFLRTFPVEDFPRLPALGREDITGDVIRLDVADVAEALRQVVRAASADDARPILTGVLMSAEEQGLRLVATDSYRLALRDLPGKTLVSEGQKVLVPSRALAELQRLLSGVDEIALWLGEHDATFDVAGVRLTTRLIEGEFPNYRQLLPSAYPNRLVVGKESLLSAVRRVKLLVRDATTPLRLSLRSDVIDLSVVTTEVGHASEEVDAKYEGGEMTVAFNPAYLIDGVEAIVGEEVVIETVDALRPAVIRAPEVGEYLYLLMPVRVS